VSVFDALNEIRTEFFSPAINTSAAKECPVARWRLAKSIGRFAKGETIERASFHRARTRLRIIVDIEPGGDLSQGGNWI